VSFDLYAFPSSGPRTVLEVCQLMDAEEQRLLTGADDVLTHGQLARDAAGPRLGR